MDDIIKNQPFCREFYVQEIKTILVNCEHIYMNIEHLLQNTNIEESQHIIFHIIQNLIRETGMLSKFFWPVREKELHCLRAKHLKKYFNISDDSPLNNKQIRNAIEHFDERLDLFLSKPNNSMGFTFRYLLGEESALQTVKQTTIYKFFDPNKLVIKIFDERLELAPILEELRNLSVICFNDRKRMTQNL